MEKTSIGLTGEYYVLAQLEHRGFVAALTLSNTKGVDILVSNRKLNKLYKVEVKTTTKQPKIETLFSKKTSYVWPMSEKHEKIIEKNLFYVFVHIKEPDTQPQYFIVPSRDVAKYVKWQHRHWLSTRKHKVKTTKMRVFRIETDDPNNYEDNWDIF